MLNRYWRALCGVSPSKELKALLERVFSGRGSTSMSANNKPSHSHKAKASSRDSCYSKSKGSPHNIGWRKDKRKGSEDSEARGKTQGVDLSFSWCICVVK